MRERIMHCFDVAREGYTLSICRERGLRVFLMSRERVTCFFLYVARNGSAYFVRKMFALKKPISGKFYVFGPLVAYMISVIFLHKQDFWVNFFSTQKCVKCDEMDVASRQRKSQQDSIHRKFVMWSNFVMTSYSYKII